MDELYFKRDKGNQLSDMEHTPDSEMIFQLFKEVEYEIFVDEYEYEGSEFKAWRDEDEMFYILHKASGTLLSWYKHLRRGLSCNKDLSAEEWKMFVELLKYERSGI